MRNLRLIGFAVVSVVLVTSAQAQHLGSRQQWQPQTENDPRVQQPVQLEIIGRAAITGLPILSEKTGVSLSVAPEDLSTVGERKFTVIAQGCSLKAIMVQLEEALQECHWDVDWSGEQFVYLLHRNSNADLAGMQQEKGISDRREAGQKEARVARVEAARAALKMTPEELAELEKTEPVLARAAREPQARQLMELFFALPADAMGQFTTTGQLSFSYAGAPEQMQKAADLSMAWYVAALQEKARLDRADLMMGYDTGGRPGRAADDIGHWRDRPSRVTVSISDHGSDFGFGVRLAITVPVTDTGGIYCSDAILPPRYVSTDEGTGAYLRILQATGSPDHDSAWEIITQNEREGVRHAREKLEARRKAEWPEPTDPDLLKVVKLPQGPTSMAEVQQALARETGLSVIGDYFTERGRFVTEEMAGGLPLWRLLYLFCEDHFGNRLGEWRKVGGCLVFHDSHWPGRAQAELPESLLLAYQEKLKTEGKFALDDLAAFAVALGDRSSGSESLPDDLARAGLRSVPYARWGLRFYASLSADQLAKARTEAGLPYSQMTIAQRQQVADVARRVSPPVSPDELSKTSFRLTEEKRERKAGDKRFLSTTTHFRFQYPERTYEEAAGLSSEVKAP